MDYTIYQEFAVNLAKIAGSNILNELNNEMTVKSKSAPHDLVTNIDLNTERLIRDKIEERYPAHAIFGEEFSQSDRQSEFLWVIDPVDGTSCLAQRKAGFSVSIGLLHKMEPVVGIVYDVMNNKLYNASKGNGAMVNDKKLILNKKSEALIALKNNAEPYRTVISELFNKSNKKWAFFPSTALAFCLVGEGNSAGMVKLTYNPWDIAGGIVIARELGCKVTDCFGKDIEIRDVKRRNPNGLICAPNSDYESLRDLVFNFRSEKKI